MPSDRSDRNAADRSDRGITDFVRRAVSAGVGAAARSKDDIMRAAKKYFTPERRTVVVLKGTES